MEVTINKTLWLQVILFGILAVQVKLKAPTAHTVLEIVKARWGTEAHIVFFIFCILTNIIVTSMLILGGAAVVEALTGMSKLRQRIADFPFCVLPGPVFYLLSLLRGSLDPMLCPFSTAFR